jgi:DNA-binding MarR family transcriptional regulator
MARGNRDELLGELDMAGRAISAAAVMFHTAMAARLGLSATESKALDLLQRHGPLTAGELGRHSGLAPASVTGLVDRLERKGFARRVPHPGDGRRVLIEMLPDKVAGFGPPLMEFVASLRELYDTFTDDELAAIVRYCNEAARRQNEVTARMTAEDG